MVYAVLEKILEVLPNCRCALSLAEKAVARPLGPIEKLALWYHKPLCPFCACNQNRFDCLQRQMRKADAERQQQKS
jgi:hypothetical protein